MGMIIVLLAMLRVTDVHRWVSNGHKGWLKYPLIRKGGKLERASWDEAMSVIVDKMKDVQRRFTNHRTAFYTSV
jgi:ferredoxin-nitrate reductase